jgi:hypothetical protein
LAVRELMPRMMPISGLVLPSMSQRMTSASRSVRPSARRGRWGLRRGVVRRRRRRTTSGRSGWGRCRRLSVGHRGGRICTPVGVYADGFYPRDWDRCGLLPGVGREAAGESELLRCAKRSNGGPGIGGVGSARARPAILLRGFFCGGVGHGWLQRWGERTFHRTETG